MKNNFLTQLKIKGMTNNVPIIADDGLAFLLDLIEKENIKSVLEIGAAIGYSAINMALLGCKVDTFERDEKMLTELYTNIKKAKLTDLITVYPYDALEYDGTLGKYDLIFIDAAKAQYQKFFTKYSPLLSKDGIIVCDNLDFHNLQPENVKRQTRQLLRKIASFKEFLNNNTEFITTIYHIGDGMSVSRRK